MDARNSTNTTTQQGSTKSEAELKSERKIRFYTAIFVVQVLILASWKAYALLAPKYL